MLTGRIFKAAGRITLMPPRLSVETKPYNFSNAVMNLFVRTLQDLMEASPKRLRMMYLLRFGNLQFGILLRVMVIPDVMMRL